MVLGLETIQSLTDPNLRHYLAYPDDTSPPLLLFSDLYHHVLSLPQYSRRKITAEIPTNFHYFST